MGSGDPPGHLRVAEGDFGVAPGSLAEGLPRIAPATPRPRPTPPDVLVAGMAGADPRTALILRLARDVGMRRGEISLAHSDDVVAMGDGKWSLTVHGKGGRERMVPISPALARRLRAADGRVFPGAVDGHLSAGHVGVLASRALPGVWSLHSVRHRCARQMWGSAGDTATVGSCVAVDHSDPCAARRQRAQAGGARIVRFKSTPLALIPSSGVDYTA